MKMGKSILGIVLATLTLVSSFIACANTIIYQPLNRDVSVTQDEWKTLINTLHSQGYKEIVIQWGQYGSVNFWQKDSFLKKPMDYASSKGFKFWLGLYLPEDYYQQMENPNTDKNNFFKQVIQKNRHLLSKLEIQDIFSEDLLLGWYLPTELTNRYIDASEGNESGLNLEPLKHLATLNTKPIAISYFLAADTSVEDSISDLMSLQSLGLNVWFQRGNGLKKRTVAENVIQKLNCRFAVVNENFQQTSNPSTPFSATADTSASQRMDSCHKPITFSLRYLPSSPLPVSDKHK